MKKNPGIAKTLKEACRLLSDWGLKESDFALFGEWCFKLQGFDIKARKGHIDIVVHGLRLPWKVKPGQEATIPPKSSRYFREYVLFREKTGADIHLIPLPLANLDQKDLRGKTKTLLLETGAKNGGKDGASIRVIKLNEQIKNYYYILGRLARKERWANEKMNRWTNYFEEFYRVAKKQSGKEKPGDGGKTKISGSERGRIAKNILCWCEKGLKLAQEKKKAAKNDNAKQADLAARAGSVFYGRGVFRGRAKGKVRIITKDSQLKSVRWGEVLVMRHTKPSVAIVLHKINAIVTDQGGIMSHAAILSREHKIPTVIATHNATKVLKDGDYIGVDGQKGVVEIIKPRKR